MAVILRATGKDLLLTNRVKDLVFGVYAWDGTGERRLIKEAGTGVFIAPHLGLTAKHVAQSFRRLDPQNDAFERRRSPLDSQYRVVRVQSEYAALAYQLTGGETPSADQVPLWKLRVNWPSFDTDISILELEPETEAATRRELLQRYVDWYLLPPPLNSWVSVFGLPDARIEIEGDNHDIEIPLEIAVCKVRRIFQPIHVHGMAEFPVFELDRELPHGFSGGPVFWNDKLVGIFSGPAFVSSLWPLVLLTYPQSDSESDKAFKDHLESGRIHAWDWADVKGRVTRLPCAEALGPGDRSVCTKSHAVLT